MKTFPSVAYICYTKSIYHTIFMVRSIRKRIKSIRNGIKGVRKEAGRDPKLQQYLSLAIGAIFLIYIVDPQWFLILQIIIFTTLMVSFELFNAAIEKLCNFVEPHHNLKIKDIKDVAAGAISVIGFSFTSLIVTQYIYLLIQTYFV